VIAVSRGSRAETAGFVARYFGRAPVDVYVDGSGSVSKAFSVPYHPDYRFVSASGKLTKRVPSGFPFG
jgi:hypothetical protein